MSASRSLPGWPSAPPVAIDGNAARELAAEVDQLAASSQYGWGHTIDFGAFRKEGLFGETFLDVAAVLDRMGWWPQRLERLRVADVGCYTGGMSLLMASRGADTVYAVDEVPEHLAQCRLLARVFARSNIQPVEDSLYRLDRHVAKDSLDGVLMAGVLYHLSDMLVGLHVLRTLLKLDGWLVMETAAIDDNEHSYANFARYVGGGWWVPTALCIRDMLEFMNFGATEIHFHAEGRCLVRARPLGVALPTFRRGLNWPFESIRDDQPRTMDLTKLAYAPRRSSA
jgi:SAM-dependent methyltransferase